MVEAKRARRAETPKQPSFHLRLRASYLYPTPYGFFSVIPVVGASIIYLPVAAIEMIEGSMATGLLIIAYATIIMGFLIDNVLRLALIGLLKRALGFTHSIGEIPIMLSMIAGLSTLGFWGIIIGPSILSVALASAQLYIDSRRNNG